jgi:hypothetical protein
MSEEPIFYIYRNVKGGTFAFHGLVKLKNLVECTITGMVSYLIVTTFAIDAPIGTQIGLFAILFLPIGILCLLGIKGYTFPEFIFMWLHFLTSKSVYHLKRIKKPTGGGKK